MEFLILLPGISCLKQITVIQNALWRKLLAKLVKPEQEESQIEDELMTMIDEAQTEGDIEEEEGELIRSAIEFNDQNAADIMTPRVDVTALEDNATIEEAADAFRDTWFSRIPVYHEDLDHIIGILHEKDFSKRRAFLALSKHSSLRQI